MDRDIPDPKFVFKLFESEQSLADEQRREQDSDHVHDFDQRVKCRT